MIKTAEEQNYIYITKDMKTITFDGINVSIPEYVFRARSRYRFNSIEGFLEKQCSNCKKWFSVCKIEYNSFKKIHDESLIHFFGKTGFSTNCRQCDNPELPPHQTPIKQPLNINLPANLKKYLKTKSYLEDRSITNILIEMLDDYSKENPVNVSFK